jgi:RES domain-containing protein
MFLYRIANKKYKDFTLSGIGAEKVGGRWNEVGTRAVYCSENVALAFLEYYIHSDNIATLPKNILLAKHFIPDDFKIDSLEQLPEDWDKFPYTASTTGIFTELAKSRDFFALKVPSSIIGIENNYILNPLYKDFGKVEIVEFLELPIDPRLK